MFVCLMMQHVTEFCDPLKELLLPWVLFCDQTLAEQQVKENCIRLLDCRSCVKVTLPLKCHSPHIG